jgi:exoribonuclease-2
VNQWQLIACAEHGVTAKLVAPFKPKDADLYAVLQSFDDTYAAYADYQNKMETFWCLRWLKQEQRDRVTATVVKGDLVRLEEIPLMLHVPGLGVHARGTRVLLDVVSIDELTVEASTRLVQVLDAPVASEVADADEGEDGDDDADGATSEPEQVEGAEQAEGAAQGEDAQSDEQVAAQAADALSDAGGHADHDNASGDDATAGS